MLTRDIIDPPLAARRCTGQPSDGECPQCEKYNNTLKLRAKATRVCTWPARSLAKLSTRSEFYQHKHAQHRQMMQRFADLGQ